MKTEGKDFDEQSNIRKNYLLKTIRYVDIFLSKHLYSSICHKEIEISKFFASLLLIFNPLQNTITSLLNIPNIPLMPELTHIHLFGPFIFFRHLILPEHFPQLSDPHLIQLQLFLLFTQNQHLFLLLDSLLVKL